MEKLDKKMLFVAWACHNKGYFSYQNWHSPLKAIFKEFVTFDPQEYSYKYGIKAMNKKFLEVVEKEQPDFIYLWLIYDEFDIETLLKIKEVSPKTRVVNFFGDDDTKFEIYTRYYSLFVDFPLVSHKLYFHKYKPEGIKNAYYSYGVNTNDFCPKDLEKKYDATFIGTPMADRAELVTFLKDNGIDIRVFGAGWERHPELKDIYFGKLSQEEMIGVLNESKINLSFSKNYQGKPSFKSRVFEASACKSFILTEHFKVYHDLLKKDKELVTFKDKKDLLEKVKYYLKNEKERREIEGRAYKKVLETYSQEAEFRKIFEDILKKEGKENLGKVGLPKLNKKVIEIDETELKLDEESLSDKVKNSDYVAFTSKRCRISKHRNYFQAYGLKKTGKEISCCDYYLYSNGIGDYLSFYAEPSFKALKKDRFFSLLDLCQLVVTKDFFVKNLDKFKDFDDNKEGLFTEERVSFILSPLIQVRSEKPIVYEEIGGVVLPAFEAPLRASQNKGRLFFDLYLYKLLLHSMFGKPYIAKYLYKRLLEKKGKKK
ncbi:hypothetical protein CMI45_01285 [Candidatus Pacearchaeota archaeon]|nr:hypothetical protein [Candidatus Pacearchaeota archaeon]MAG38004.1 hypothetical protein [Candidatus Pacearchaeota archaeon]|tara:strand:- start:165 stop:1790 length:1626 start_codon:yes stop_codon:yes gene_type:complete